MSPNSFQRILTGLVLFCATLAIAIYGYMAVGWSFLEATYMVVITIFGIGYGEVRPIDTDYLRWFTIFVIVAGTFSSVYLAGGFVQMITAGEINRVLSTRRMNKEIESLRSHTIICGFGRMGDVLARKLYLANLPFVVIENNPERVALAEARGYLVINGDATDENSLVNAGIDRAYCLAVVLPDDASNVFITLTARGLNPNLNIIARGEQPSTEKKLKLAGANHVVLPLEIGAERVAYRITHPAALDFLQESESRQTVNELLAQINIQFEELTIEPNSPFAGQALSSIEAKGKGAFIVVAVRKPDGRVIPDPSHDFIVHGDDIVILLGHKGDIPQFARRYSLKRDLRYRGSAMP
ncbi:MAG: potassium channel family protein [Pseudanabaenaceae cyanobacterium]